MLTQAFEEIAKLIESNPNLLRIDISRKDLITLHYREKGQEKNKDFSCPLKLLIFADTL